MNKAIDSFCKAIEIDPSDPETYIGLGVALERVGDAEGAIENYCRATELDPQS